MLRCPHVAEALAEAQATRKRCSMRENERRGEARLCSAEATRKRCSLRETLYYRGLLHNP